MKIQAANSNFSEEIVRVSARFGAACSIACRRKRDVLSFFFAIPDKGGLLFAFVQMQMTAVFSVIQHVSRFG